MVTKELLQISEKLKCEINPLQIYLFGSYAKGTQNPDSDYDIYLVVADDAGDNIELSQKAYKSLRGIRTTPVDIIVGNISMFKSRQETPTIEAELARTGVVLYAKP